MKKGPEDLDNTKDKTYEQIMNSPKILAELHDQSIIVAEQMRRYGGEFHKALADCISASDNSNMVKIRLNWPQDWERYYVGHGN